MPTTGQIAGDYNGHRPNPIPSDLIIFSQDAIRPGDYLLGKKLSAKNIDVTVEQKIDIFQKTA